MSKSWGDVGNNGKWMPSFGTTANFETRCNFHYRAGLNSIPLLEWFRTHPDDYNAIMLLEIGLGAQAGTLANIDPETGATSMGLHMLPHILDYDPHSGDYGLGFFGHAIQSASYVVFDDQSFGGYGGAHQWKCYQCNFIDGRPISYDRKDIFLLDAFSVEPKDSMHIRAFVEPICLYIVLDTGHIKTLKFDFKNSIIVLLFDDEGPSTFDTIRVRLEKTCESNVRPGTDFAPLGIDPRDTIRGAFVFPANTTYITITWRQ